MLCCEEAFLDSFSLSAFVVPIFGSLVVSDSEAVLSSVIGLAPDLMVFGVCVAFQILRLDEDEIEKCSPPSLSSLSSLAAILCSFLRPHPEIYDQENMNSTCQEENLTADFAFGPEACVFPFGSATEVVVESQLK